MILLGIVSNNMLLLSIVYIWYQAVITGALV